MNKDKENKIKTIAKAVGWSNFRYIGDKLSGTKPDGTDPVNLPDYFVDYNAIHDIINRLMHKDGFPPYFYEKSFMYALADICEVCFEPEITVHDITPLVFATPEQLANAVLNVVEGLLLNKNYESV